MFGKWFCKNSESRQDLYIGADMSDMRIVENPDSYSLAIDALIREKSPEKIFCMSTSGNLAYVKKVLRYLAELGGEVGVAPQLPEEEVAAIFGVDVATYRAVLDDPEGDAGTF